MSKSKAFIFYTTSAIVFLDWMYLVFSNLEMTPQMLLVHFWYHYLIGFSIIVVAAIITIPEK